MSIELYDLSFFAILFHFIIKIKNFCYYSKPIKLVSYIFAAIHHILWLKDNKLKKFVQFLHKLKHRYAMALFINLMFPKISLLWL